MGAYTILRSMLSNYRRIGFLLKLVESIPSIMLFAYGNDFSFGITFLYNVMSVNYFVGLCRFVEGLGVGMHRVHYLHTFALLLLFFVL